MACRRLDLNVEFSPSFTAEFDRMCKRDKIANALSYNLSEHLRDWDFTLERNEALFVLTINPRCHRRNGNRRRLEP